MHSRKNVGSILRYAILKLCVLYDALPYIFQHYPVWVGHHLGDSEETTSGFVHRPTAGEK